MKGHIIRSLSRPKSFHPCRDRVKRLLREYSKYPPLSVGGAVYEILLTYKDTSDVPTKG